MSKSLSPVEYLINECSQEDRNKKIGIYQKIIYMSNNTNLLKNMTDSVLLFDSLINSCPFVIIDRETEKIKAYQQYPKAKVDYLYLEAYKNKTIKDRKYSQNNIGSRSEGRKSYNIQGELNKKEDRYSFLYFDKNNCAEAKCTTNFLQSPINIEGPFIAEEFKLTYNFHVPRRKMIIRNDRKVIKFVGHFGSFSHNKQKFLVKQFYIHYPSEHTYGENQTRYAMELQILGKEENTQRAAVIATMFEYGEKKNEFISGLGFNYDNPLYAKKLRNGEDVVIDNREILDKIDLGNIIGIKKDDLSNHFITYNGTISYDQCQEAQWFIMEEKLSVSRLQVEYFEVLFGKNGNIRPLQLLNGRVLKGF